LADEINRSRDAVSLVRMMENKVTINTTFVLEKTFLVRVTEPYRTREHALPKQVDVS
jgi:hypothetical protein